MENISLNTLVVALILLVVISAFFSAAEIALMTLDRYRLRHLAKSGHHGARLTLSLLARTDRLIGVILLGSNFTNALFSTIATALTFRLLGEDESSVVVATIIIALTVLILTDLAPKTLAALRPERIALPSSYVLGPLLKLLYPAVWVVNGLANGLLRLGGIRPQDTVNRPLSYEELRSVLNEASGTIPRRHQRMLLNILDLEKATIEDIMVPRSEIVGLDLDHEWPEIERLLVASQHTRLPVYRGSIDEVVGILHLRNVLHLLAQGTLDERTLLQVLREPYFIPAGTTLNNQLLNFQKQRRRIALVVDEYGDMQGLVTLEDILEEIVGEFTTDVGVGRDITPSDDGSYLVEASANVRQINRLMHWELPTDGPKTLNGVILEYLETIPEPGTSLLIAGYPIEILQASDNAVKTVRIKPALRRPVAATSALGTRRRTN